MSPSAYIVALPLGLIAVSTWLVKMEGDNFLQSDRTSDIQTQARNVDGQHVKKPTPQPAQQFDHDRYGWQDNVNEVRNSLGNDRSRRSLGARPEKSPDWMQSQYEAIHSAAAAKPNDLPPIPGYIESAPMGASPFSTVPAESGFHITSNEATKLDLKTQKVIFSGNVSLTSPQFDLTATHLVVLLNPDKKTFRLAEATGDVNVQIKSGPPEKRYRGQSAKAVYEPVSGTITMTGWPKIQGQGQEIIAAAPETKVMLYAATGKLLTEGRTQTRVARQLIAEDSAKRDVNQQSGQ